MSVRYGAPAPQPSIVTINNDVPQGEREASPNTSNRLDVFDIVFQEALLDPEANLIRGLNMDPELRIQKEAFSTEDGMRVVDEEKVKAIVSELFASKEEWAERFRKEKDFCYHCRQDVQLFTQLLDDFAFRTFGTSDSTQWKPVVKRWEPIEHLVAQTGYPLDHYNRLTGANVQFDSRPYYIGCPRGCDLWEEYHWDY